MRFFIYLIPLVLLTSCFSSNAKKTDHLFTVPEVMEIIKNDNIAEFEEFIKSVNNIDTLLLYKDENLSLLGYSSKHSSIKIANRLIELNANIEIGQENDIYCFDALKLAVENNKLEIVKLLLEHGANINAIYDDNGLTPLVISCKNNNYNISKLLIDYGANVNGAGDLGGDYTYTPLREAIYCNNDNLMKLLLDNGAREIEKP